jgi:hypothetical protein
MPTVAQVGTSKSLDSTTAGREAAAAAMTGLDGATPSLLLVFASADHDHQALVTAVSAVAPGTPVAGCSGEGVIAHDHSDESLGAVAVMAIASDRIGFRAFLFEGYGTDPESVGRQLAELVNAEGAEARCLWLMPDGLQGDCTALLAALHTGITHPVPIVGGTAADAMTFERTYQYGEGRAVSGGVSAVLIVGEADVELAVSHGCQPVGLERIVTRSDGGWIHEIDGEPAWVAFKEYLADDVDDLNGEGIVHLCIGERLGAEAAGDYDPYVIRTPLQLDQATGSLFFPGGGLTEGRAIQLTRRDQDKIREKARACAEQLQARHADRTPDLVLQFDCAGRGRILWGGCAAAEIVAPLRQALGPATPWMGFHTYGEIAPIAGRPYYHNYTVALCALYEKAPA